MYNLDQIINKRIPEEDLKRCNILLGEFLLKSLEGGGFKTDDKSLKLFKNIVNFKVYPSTITPLYSMELKSRIDGVEVLSRSLGKEFWLGDSCYKLSEDVEVVLLNVLTRLNGYNKGYLTSKSELLEINKEPITPKEDNKPKDDVGFIMGIFGEYKELFNQDSKLFLNFKEKCKEFNMYKSKDEIFEDYKQGRMPKYVKEKFLEALTASFSMGIPEYFYFTEEEKTVKVLKLLQRNILDFTLSEDDGSLILNLKYKNGSSYYIDKLYYFSNEDEPISMRQSVKGILSNCYNLIKNHLEIESFSNLANKSCGDLNKFWELYNKTPKDFYIMCEEEKSEVKKDEIKKDTKKGFFSRLFGK